jgi:hypothetical protein
MIMINEDGVKDGTYEYTTKCGWIDWKHATPDRPDLPDFWSQFPHMIKKGQKPLNLHPLRSGGYLVYYRPDLGYLKHKMPEIRHKMFVYKIPNWGPLFNFDENKYKGAALYIYKKGCEFTEKMQGKSSILGKMATEYSFEDLVSNLIAFYMYIEGWSEGTLRSIAGGFSDKKYRETVSLQVVRNYTKMYGRNIKKLGKYGQMLSQMNLRASGWDKAFLFNNFCEGSYDKKFGWHSLPKELQTIKDIPVQETSAQSKKAMMDNISPFLQRFASESTGRGWGRRPGKIVTPKSNKPFLV